MPWHVPRALELMPITIKLQIPGKIILYIMWDYREIILVLSEICRVQLPTKCFCETIAYNSLPSWGDEPEICHAVYLCQYIKHTHAHCRDWQGGTRAWFGFFQIKSVTKDSWTQSQVGQYKLEVAWMTLFKLFKWEKYFCWNSAWNSELVFLKKED